MHAAVYVLDVSKIDKNEDNEVLKFINKHITSAPQDETEYPEIRNLVKKV